MQHEMSSSGVSGTQRILKYGRKRLNSRKSRSSHGADKDMVKVSPRASSLPPSLLQFGDMIQYSTMPPKIFDSGTPRRSLNGPKDMILGLIDPGIALMDFLKYAPFLVMPSLLYRFTLCC